MVQDGNTFRVANSTETDYGDFAHDGTDFSTAFTNTAQWVISGLDTDVVISNAGGTDSLTIAKAGATNFGLMRWTNELGVARWRLGAANVTDDDFNLYAYTSAGAFSHIAMHVDGANFDIEFDLNGNPIVFDNATIAYWYDGVDFRIYDAGNTDYMSMSHDGTDFNFAATTTNTIDFTGATWYQFSADVKARSGLQVAGGVGSTGVSEVISFVDVSGGTARFGGYNWGAAAWQPVLLSGSDIQVSAATTLVDINSVTTISLDAGTNISLETGTNGVVTLGEGTTAKFQLNNNTDTVDIRDGYLLRIKDSADTDYGEFNHDGTDFNVEFANTTEMNINTVPLHLGHGSLYMSEQAAAAADTAGRGQLWVKNTTPCQLWFTDDAGTDTQIV
jgi:hypothetical protein